MVVYIKVILSVISNVIFIKFHNKKTHQTVSVFTDTNLKHIKEFVSRYHLKIVLKKSNKW